MKSGSWQWLVILAAVALAIIGAAGAAAGRVAQATGGDDVQWSSEFNLSFSPAEAKRAGWEKQAESIATGLNLRLAARNASLTTARQDVADGGVDLDYKMAGKGGLDQFKAVMFDDAQAIGGMLGGPADMTLTGDISADENLYLVLESNISAGYTWQVDRGQSSFVQPVGGDEFQSKGNLLGAPDRQVIALKGTGSGRATAVLHYRRPWMEQETPNRHYRVDAARLSSIADLSNPAPVSAVPSAKGHVPPGAQTLSPTSLPSAWDWRSQGKVSPIRNQGSCGSCWAFSTMAAFESNMLINYQVPDASSDNFSEQYLISCNQSGWSCNGGYFAHDYNISAYGLKNNPPGGVTEAAFPYQGGGVSCGTTYNHPERLTSWYYVNPSVSVPAASDIKDAIYNHGPVSAAVCVGSAFNNYSGGVFSTDEKSACGGGVNHAILLVGWDDSTGSWIMKNSWGTYWGESGYMRIKYGISNVGYQANYVVGTQGVPPACYTVTVTSNGNGTVNRNVSPNCNSGTGYTSGTNLTLTAVPASGYAFTGWSGDVTGKANPLSATVGAAMSITATFAPVNLLADPSFENDANGDNRPDSWTSSAKFVRSTAVVQDLVYSGRLMATDNRNVAISQGVKRIKAGTPYRFSGYVNIPPTADAFTFKLQLVWRDSLGYVLRTDTMSAFTGATNGWVNVTASPVAPARAVSVGVKLYAMNLNAAIYVDNFYFGR